jgi:hypothetical protein
MLSSALVPLALFALIGIVACNRLDRRLAAPADRHCNRRRLHCRDHQRLYWGRYPVDRFATDRARHLVPGLCRARPQRPAARLRLL